MKPEPLKDKQAILINENNTRFISEQYIKSAVEWLKEEVNKLKVKNALVLCDVYELIDEAFEDVMK